MWGRLLSIYKCKVTKIVDISFEFWNNFVSFFTREKMQLGSSLVNNAHLLQSLVIILAIFWTLYVIQNSESRGNNLAKQIYLCSAVMGAGPTLPVIFAISTCGKEVSLM